MTTSLPVGKLRQNPTGYLRAVSAGERFTITNHQKPVADLVPHRPVSGISGQELMRRLRSVHRDETWLDQLQADREQIVEQDPWA